MTAASLNSSLQVSVLTYFISQPTTDASFYICILFVRQVSLAYPIDRSIVTASGTVRGRKNLVRAVMQLFGPETTPFASPLQERLYNEEKGKIVG